MTNLSDRVREHAIFVLTQSKEAGAIPAIVREVHDDKSPRVRSQALFWLAQTAAHQTRRTPFARPSIGILKRKSRRKPCSRSRKCRTAMACRF